MVNKTSATLMLQTIMVLMDKQNSTDVTNFPSNFNEDVELERCYSPYGCFSKAYPWTEHRPDNYFPVSPDTLGVREYEKALKESQSDKNKNFFIDLIKNGELLLNGCTDLNEFFCVCSSGFEDGLDSHLDPIGGAAVGFFSMRTKLFNEVAGTAIYIYAVFTRRNRNMPVILQAKDTEIIRNSNLDRNGPFYFISHGFLEGGHKLWIQHMADALLNQEGNSGASVIVVDWRRGSQPPYGQAVANIRLVGVMTAFLIRNIYEVLKLSSLENFHFIGHSLGAHLGGYCGHALQKKFNLKLGRITGLDPAAPYFSNTVTLVRLDRSDAEYVDIIHSNAMPLYFSGFGITEPIGHVDFYPNGGSIQPGCKNDGSTHNGNGNDMYSQVVKYVSCNHERSYELFIESIAPTCPFVAIQCKSYEAFLEGNCTTCDNKHLCVPMGLHSYKAYKRLKSGGAVDTNSNIALYALTGRMKPFCRVHYEFTLKISNSSESRIHGPDVGRVSVVLVDRNNNKSDHKFLNDEQKYYRPGDVETKLIAFKDTGLPPQTVVVEWKYEANLLNPMTWRLLKSSSIYVEYIKISSIEYNTVITVCPKLKKPVVTNLPTVMKTKYCVFS